MLTEKWTYLKDTKKYLYSVMLSMDQDKLIETINDLSYHELRMALGAGVPGAAWQYAVNRKREMNQEIKAKIQEIGQRETKLEDLKITYVDDYDGEKRVQTSEKGRKSDS